MKYTEKNKTINVWLPNKLFSALKKKIGEQQRKKESAKLQLAQAAYLLNLVIYMPVKHKDKYQDGYVPICSEAHKNFKFFSKYMEFLVDSGFLIRHEKNYSTTLQKTDIVYHLRRIKVNHPQRVKLSIAQRMKVNH